MLPRKHSLFGEGGKIIYKKQSKVKYMPNPKSEPKKEKSLLNAAINLFHSAFILSNGSNQLSTCHLSDLMKKEQKV